MNRRVGLLAAWSGAGALLLFTAHLLINSTYAFYDDEGYVLFTLRSFLAGGRLYDEVFTQYGPWPYVYHQLVTTIFQTPLTHMLGRSLTGIHWVGCALLCGQMTLRLTGRPWAAITAVLTTFGLLWQMCLEPSHPGSHLAFLAALTGSLAVGLPETRRPALTGGAVGVVAALLFLTKINVGLLMITGIGCIALRYTAWPTVWRRPAAMAAAAGLLAVAWVLMLQNLHRPWPLIFAVQFTLASAGLIWVTPFAWIDLPLQPRVWWGTVAGFILAGLVLVATVCVQGTTWGALFEAVVISPVKQPTRFTSEFTWLPAVWPVAAMCAIVSARAGWEMRRKGCLAKPTRCIVIAIRIGTLAAFIQQAAQWPTITGVSHVIVFCLPLTPVFVIPLGPRAGANSRSLASGWMLAFLALPQVLQAFPVAGSQMGWGTFLLLPLFIWGTVESICAITSLTAAHGRRLTAGFGVFLVAVGGWQFWLLFERAQECYFNSEAIGLPGAEGIHLPGDSRQTLRLLTLNAAVHTDMLFSQPGMFSYNMWSGSRTPTTRNATHWSWLLNSGDQLAIDAQLEKTPRRGIILNNRLDRFMSENNIQPEGPLQTHLRASYRTLFEHGDFSFLVPLDSKAVPFGQVEHLVAKSAGANKQLEMILRTNLIIDGRPDRVALERLDPPRLRLQDYLQTGGRVYLEPITSTGETLGPPVVLPANRSFKGLFRLTIFHDSDPELASPLATALFVRDTEGHVIAEAVF